MLEETTNSTDVTGGSPSPGADSSAAPSSVGATETQSQAQAQGGVSAQPETQGEQSTQQATESDPLKDVPTVEELTAQAAQKEPRAQALLQLRTAYEALKGEHSPLKSRFEPWQPVVEKYGDPARATTRLELADSLFGVDPETKQPTSLPFLESLAAKSPATHTQLVRDVLSLRTEDGRPLLEHVVQSLGYVPKGANVAPSADVDPEKLAVIPDDLHAAYKSFSAAARADLDDASPAAREEYLRERKANLERDQRDAEAERGKVEEKAKAQRDAQANYQAAVEQRVAGIRTSEIKSAHDRLASEWKPTDDPQLNTVYRGFVLTTLRSFLDSEFRTENAEWLKGVGVELPQNYGDLVSSIEAAAEKSERYERAGEQFLAAEAKAEEAATRERLRAYNDLAAKALMKHFDAAVQTLERGDAEALAGAREPRTVFSGGQSPSGGGSGNLVIQLPPGVMPGSPEAGQYAMKQLGLGG